MKLGICIALLSIPLFTFSQGFTRIPESVSKVLHYTHGKVKIIQGSEPGYTIEGKAPQAISLSVRNEKLKIEKKWFTSLAESDSIVIIVTLKNVSYLSISGPGSIEAGSRISGMEISLNNNGSGKLLLHELICENLDVSLSGSGSIDLRKTTNSTVNLQVNGSGQLNIQGSTSLRSDLRFSGSGKIELNGDAPNLNCVINGSGDLNALKYITNSATLNVSGSGNARINTQRLFAKYPVPAMCFTLVYLT